MKREDQDFVKGVVAGIAGGLFASFMMEQFQALWTAASNALESEMDEAGHRPKDKAKAESKPATVKVADAISQKVAGRKIPKKRQELAGAVVHYTMGASSAAVYGGLAEIAPEVTVGKGLVFGAGVWLLADEVALPALGFAKGPKDIPLSTHAYALVSHLVYGCLTELVRSAFRKAL